MSPLVITALVGIMTLACVFALAEWLIRRGKSGSDGDDNSATN